MRKRNIILITILSVLVLVIVARYTRQIKSVSATYLNGNYRFSFNSKLKYSTRVNYSGVTAPGWIEVSFSNHMVVRFGLSQGTQHVSMWEDPSGRTRIWPILNVNCNLKQQGSIPLGKLFTEYAGSIIDTLKITSITVPDRQTKISLSKSIFSNKFISNQCILKLQRNFHLKKLEMPATIEDGHVQTWEYITISPDGNYCGVSSFDKNVYVIGSHTGKSIWKYNIHDGELSTIAYSKDGKSLLAGEHSADGNIYCFNAKNGQLRWKYRTADDVGSLENTLLVGGRWGGIVKPNAREIIAGSDSLAYARTIRSRYYESKGKRIKESIYRLYCLNINSGKKVWTFPNDSNLVDVSASTINVSADGSYVSWVYFDYDRKINPVIMVFNGRTGKKLWEYQTNTVEQYFLSSTAYSGLCISSDNRFAAVPLNDGRVFLFNNDLSIKNNKGIVYKILNLTPPIDAGTVPVMTYITKLAFTNSSDLIALTGNTYTTPFASTKVPPVYHPHANSVFCFTKDGELKWRFTAGGNPSDLSLSSGKYGEFLILPCAHNVRSKDINEHGFYIFNISGTGGGFSRLVDYYHTNGICVNACISQDQKRIFAIEAPIDMDESTKEDLQGSHRILFFDFKPEYLK
jgi:outer membrane protein assembly factor BamB